MGKRQHPSDEKLMALLDAAGGASDERAQIDTHVNTCSTCTVRLDALRKFIAVLGEAVVWDRRELKIKPRRGWVKLAAEVVSQLRDEEAAAAKVIGDVLTGPAKWWRTRAMQNEESRTYGFVKKLLEESVRMTDFAPADAVEASAIAVEIANDLHIQAYPFDLVISARAHAWRDYGFSLFYVGRFPDALQAIDRAERLFAQLPAPEFELARTSLVRAAIYRSTDRATDAIPLTRRAASCFATYGDRERFLKARMTEAAMLHESGSVADALAIWQSLEHDPALDSRSLAGLLHNIGLAHRDLGRFDQARAYVASAATRFEDLGMAADRVRSRWVMGQLFVMEGRVREGVSVLRQAWREFDELEMNGSSALVALEVAEALLIMGEPEEVPAICRMLLDHFTERGRTSRAVTALAFLREAVAAGKATPLLVQQVRDFVKDLPRNPARAFKPITL